MAVHRWGSRSSGTGPGGGGDPKQPVFGRAGTGPYEGNEPASPFKRVRGVPPPPPAPVLATDLPPREPFEYPPVDEELFREAEAEYWATRDPKKFRPQRP